MGNVKINKTTKKTGFTIVELVLVITIIGIISGIIVVAYNGVKHQAAVALLQADLKSADRQLGLFRVDHSGKYPDDIDSMNNGRGLEFTDQAELTYSPHNDLSPADYCLSAVIDGTPMHVSRYVSPTEGYCDGHGPVQVVDAPTLLTASDSTTAITVSWDLIDGAETYKLEWALSDNFSGASSVDGITESSYEVTGLNEGTTYYFRAYAVNEAGSSDASAVVSEMTQQAAPEGAPSITATVNSPSQITVSWAAVDGATSYRLDYSEASNFSPATTIEGVSGTNQAVTGLSAGKRYYFRVYAVNGAGLSAASNTVNGITTISAPDSPSVSATIPGATRSASSGPWAKDYHGNPTSGTWYYAKGSVSSSTCASGTTRQQRARVQYNSPTTWGAWTGWTTSTSFYSIQPNSPYGIRFQVQTRCYTSLYTSAGSGYGYGCRWRSGSTSCSGF